MMLLFEEDGFKDAAAVWREIESLEALAHDLRRMLRGGAPTPDEIEAAPLISAWIAVDREVPALVGKVGDHPVLPGPRTVTTSELAVWGVGKGWVRTSSRFYKLGEAFGSNVSRARAT